MIALMASADRVVTDSGGIQKEAYMLKVPCKRKNTEWVETIETGWNVLVGADKKRILENIKRPKENLHHPDLYGRSAAKKIVDHLKTQGLRSHYEAY